MRLTAGSYRELHWHTAGEWAFMFCGNARITVLKPDGTIFIDDVSQGDLLFFPSVFPHSIQGLAPDGCGGEVRVVDSRNFPASKAVADGLVKVKPGGMRELHWHPNASEWQFYIAGTGRMTVFFAEGNARTMDFNASDVGFVPKAAHHHIENSGETDLVLLEIFKSNRFVDLNNWIRHLPLEFATAHLNLDEAEILKIPSEKLEVIGG